MYQYCYLSCVPNCKYFAQYLFSVSYISCIQNHITSYFTNWSNCMINAISCCTTSKHCIRQNSNTFSSLIVQSCWNVLLRNVDRICSYQHNVIPLKANKHQLPNCLRSCLELFDIISNLLCLFILFLIPYFWRNMVCHLPVFCLTNI